MADGPLRYRISTGLSSRVARLNAPWNAEATTTEAETSAAFVEAMCLTTHELATTVLGYVNHWLPARSIVERALASASRDVHPSGRILRLDSFCPWKEHLFELEAEAAAGAASTGAQPPAAGDKRPASASVAPPVLYMLYADVGGSWRIQAVPQSPESFASRKPMPAAWRGVRDDTLSALTGVPGCIFVHASGFIGGAATYEAARALAVLALEAE